MALGWESFLLVVGRMSGLFISTPVWSSRQIPAQVKIFFILMFSALVSMVTPIDTTAALAGPGRKWRAGHGDRRIDRRAPGSPRNRSEQVPGAHLPIHRRRHEQTARAARLGICDFPGMDAPPSDAARGRASRRDRHHTHPLRRAVLRCHAARRHHRA